ncbi:2'-5' RNA ligase family protein [Microbacterium sp. EYE_5]|nr:2'-5' RNA ligase family protein [Microbacterium sp. EYE_382]MCK6085451.1 2'-5' RNA ligase family protein [Microbacterium sp. EYE_384]MCK6122324.1 2'-5' RNA ligase family protein [Microbacterium sp. EYE_80]MCK6126214.1 2'-5' RNA ligase family protein [Microbacterium sp. EYE_79]MCK6141135.1 2'-5' RNA ligase family protein [Microbacterium sp. EYE_39]MCK6217861.1 2'-5' RNA ligase family protein [Microbacterium sp. EYE_5]MCK6226655.1 2'-5' RNA ligase family protein [Microbacterium sp. EYE_77]M
MRRRFMNTPEQLASLEGQQYLVLRPVSGVADLYSAEQRDALSTTDLPHPHTGHVTLRGFFESTRRDELGELVRAWAAAQQPIELVVDGVDAFPDPWRILILRLARTDSLVSAYATLTDALETTDLRRLGELPLDDWIFHMSVVYGKTLADDAWRELESARVRRSDRPEREVLREVELVSYEDGQEHSLVFPLGG